MAIAGLDITQLIELAVLGVLAACGVGASVASAANPIQIENSHAGDSSEM